MKRLGKTKLYTLSDAEERAIKGGFPQLPASAHKIGRDGQEYCYRIENDGEASILKMAFPFCT